MDLIRAAELRLPPEAAFSGLTAAWLHGLDVEPCSPIQATVPKEVGVSGRSGIAIRRSRLGQDVIEITRQRSRWNLEKTLTRTCPECAGTGHVKTDLSVVMDLRRELSRVFPLYGPHEVIRVRVRPTLAQLAQEQPDLFSDLSQTTGVALELVPDETLHLAAYDIVPR